MSRFVHNVLQFRGTVMSSFYLNISKSLLINSINSCNLHAAWNNWYTSSTIAIVTTKLKFCTGEFGIVYKGLLKKSFTQAFSETVAVKTLKGAI